MKEQDIQELLKPRVKCKGNGNFHFPGSIFKPGEILEVVQDGARLVSQKTGGSVDWLKYKNYPHLFEEIFWYEERDQSQMPEYVKRIDGSEVFERVFRYDGGGSIMVKFPKGIYGKGTIGPIGLLNVLPATKTEYNQYLNQQNKKP